MKIDQIIVELLNAAVSINESWWPINFLNINWIWSFGLYRISSVWYKSNTVPPNKIPI